MSITIRLTAREIDLLDSLAGSECRSRTGQATWLVVSRLRAHADQHMIDGGE